MEKYVDFIKAVIRPFIIVWGFVVYGVLIINAVEVPDLLAGIIAAVIFEYFGERAVFRFKENSRKTGGGEDK